MPIWLAVVLILLLLACLAGDLLTMWDAWKDRKR